MGNAAGNGGRRDTFRRGLDEAWAALGRHPSGHRPGRDPNSERTAKVAGDGIDASSTAAGVGERADLDGTGARSGDGAAGDGVRDGWTVEQMQVAMAHGAERELLVGQVEALTADLSRARDEIRSLRELNDRLVEALVVMNATAGRVLHDTLGGAGVVSRDTPDP